MSGQLDQLGFMGFLGARLAARLGGLPPAAAGLCLLLAYVLHYLFVSQTAHLLALLGVCLDVGAKLGVPLAPFAFLLLFATNFFSANTPQGSSANLLFAGSGYLPQGAPGHALKGTMEDGGGQRQHDQARPGRAGGPGEKGYRLSPAAVPRVLARLPTRKARSKEEMQQCVESPSPPR